MALEEPFTTASPQLVTYDFTDVVNNTGTVNYEGAQSEDSAGVDYYLSREVMYSSDVTSSASSGGVLSKDLDLDFDVFFQTTQTIRGTVRSNITIGAYGTNGTNGVDVYAILKLRKWDGTTETEIANVQTVTITGTSNTIKSQIMNVEIPITTDVIIPEGTYLRMTVEVWGVAAGAGGTGLCGMGHDPKDRNDPRALGSGKIINDDETTVFQVHVPFKLEL